MHEKRFVTLFGSWTALCWIYPCRQVASRAKPLKAPATCWCGCATTSDCMTTRPCMRPPAWRISWGARSHFCGLTLLRKMESHWTQGAAGERRGQVGVHCNLNWVSTGRQLHSATVVRGIDLQPLPVLVSYVPSYNLLSLPLWSSCQLNMHCPLTMACLCVPAGLLWMQCALESFRRDVVQRYGPGADVVVKQGPNVEAVKQVGILVGTCFLWAAGGDLVFADKSGGFKTGGDLGLSQHWPRRCMENVRCAEAGAQLGGHQTGGESVLETVPDFDKCVAWCCMEGLSRKHLMSSICEPCTTPGDTWGVQCRCV
jgi:hypothetical protein